MLYYFLAIPNTIHIIVNFNLIFIHFDINNISELLMISSVPVILLHYYNHYKILAVYRIDILLIYYLFKIEKEKFYSTLLKLATAWSLLVFTIGFEIRILYRICKQFMVLSTYFNYIFFTVSLLLLLYFPISFILEFSKYYFIYL